MALYQVSAGDRILAADLNQFYSILKGVAASGESVTLIYNAAGSLIIQPSSDPAAATEAVQIKNNASTVQSALSFDGRFYAADGLVGTPGVTFEQDKDTGLYRTGANAAAWANGGVIVSPLAIMVASGGAHAPGFVPDPGASGGTTKFLREDATWAVPSEPNRVTTYHVTDDFGIGQGAVGTAANQPSMAGLNWFMRSVGTTETGVFIASVANHPGIFELDTSATTTLAIELFSNGNGGWLLPADTFDSTWIIRPNATVDANMVFRFGLIDSNNPPTTGMTAPTNGIYVEKLTGDTQYFGVCRNGGVQTRTAAFAAVTNGTWVKFRIRRVDASTIGFTQDANAEVLVTTNIPTAVMFSVIAIGNNSTANSKKLDIDLYDMQVTGLTR